MLPFKGGVRLEDEGCCQYLLSLWMFGPQLWLSFVGMFCPTNPMICRGISLPSAESWKDWKLLLLRNVAQVAWLDFLHLLWACGIWRQEDSSKVGFSDTPRHMPRGPTAGQPARFLPSKWKFQMSLCPLGHVRTTDAQEGAFIGLDVSKNRTPQAPKLILLHVKPWSVPHKLPRCRMMSRSRCQVLVAGDSLELFDIDLGEQKWAVQPDGHVQVTVGLGSPLKRQLILGQECYDGPIPEPVPRGFVFIYYIIWLLYDYIYRYGLSIFNYMHFRSF